jgi:hypothetical protein
MEVVTGVTTSCALSLPKEMVSKTSVMSETRDLGSAGNLNNLAVYCRLPRAGIIQRLRFERQTAVNTGLCLRRSRRIVDPMTDRVESNSLRSMRSQHEIADAIDVDHCILD